MSYLSFTKQKDKPAKGVFINRCFIVVICLFLAWIMYSISSCSHTPIKINVDPATNFIHWLFDW